MRKAAIDGVYALAKRDPRVVFVGSDLGAGTLEAMKQEFPERFFMEGVSEAHVIGMSAGLAFEGFIPYINTIATFLTRRCYEQVAIDLCKHGLPARLIGSGGGAVYAPLGPTHMALDDIAIMRAIPGMSVVAVSDAPEMKRLMEASLAWPGPLYIRLGKGGDPVVSSDGDRFEIGRAIVRKAPGDVLFVSTGVMTHRALQAAQILAHGGISAGVVHAHTLKPFDDATVLVAAKGVRAIVTVEEHSIVGGLGSIVAEMLADNGVRSPLIRLAFPDSYISNFGDQDSVLELVGLQPAQIAAKVSERLASLTTRAATA